MGEVKVVWLVLGGKATQLHVASSNEKNCLFEERNTSVCLVAPIWLVGDDSLLSSLPLPLLLLLHSVLFLSLHTLLVLLHFIHTHEHRHTQTHAHSASLTQEPCSMGKLRFKSYSELRERVEAHVAKAFTKGYARILHHMQNEIREGRLKERADPELAAFHFYRAAYMLSCLLSSKEYKESKVCNHSLTQQSRHHVSFFLLCACQFGREICI